MSKESVARIGSVLCYICRPTTAIVRTTAPHATLLPVAREAEFVDGSLEVVADVDAVAEQPAVHIVVVRVMVDGEIVTTPLTLELALELALALVLKVREFVRIGRIVADPVALLDCDSGAKLRPPLAEPVAPVAAATAVGVVVVVASMTGLGLTPAGSVGTTPLSVTAVVVESVMSDVMAA